LGVLGARVTIAARDTDRLAHAADDLAHVALRAHPAHRPRGDVLRRLQIDQNESPEHGMTDSETDHEPQARFRIARTFRKPRRQPPKAGTPARTRRRGQNRCSRHASTPSAFWLPVKSAKREQNPL